MPAWRRALGSQHGIGLTSPMATRQHDAPSSRNPHHLDRTLDLHGHLARWDSAMITALAIAGLAITAVVVEATKGLI